MSVITAVPLTARPLTARPLTAMALGVADAADPLVWHAATYNPATFELQAQRVGTGTPAFTSSAMLLPDNNGVYVTVASNAAPWHGARWSGGVAYADDGAGNLLSPIPSLYGAPAYTNLILRSNDLTHAPWSSVGAGGSALNAVGITGAANTAATLTDAEAGTARYISQNVAGTTAVQSTAIYYIKKDAVTSRFVGLRVSGNVSYQCQINTSTGATILTENSPTVEVESAGDYWKVYFQSTANASNTPIYVYPAIASTWGSYQLATTGSCVVGQVEFYYNKTIASVIGMAPIITAASTVTTSAITSVMDSGNWVDTIGGLYLDVTVLVAQNILSTFLSVSGSNFQLSDGTNTATKAWVTNTSYKVGIAWDATAGTMAICVDGVWSSNATYDGSLLSGALDFARSAAGVMLYRGVKRWTAANLAEGKALVDAEMAA